MIGKSGYFTNGRDDMLRKAQKTNMRNVRKSVSFTVSRKERMKRVFSFVLIFSVASHKHLVFVIVVVQTADDTNGDLTPALEKGKVSNVRGVVQELCELRSGGIIFGRV